MRSDAERERLRETFDQTAEIYHRVRPDCPEGLCDDLVALAGLKPGDRLLEVGCTTGKATLPLARRGFRITGAELGGPIGAARLGDARGAVAGTAVMRRGRPDVTRRRRWLTVGWRAGSG